MLEQFDFYNVIQVLQNMGKYIRKEARTNLSKKNKNVNKDLYNSLSYGVDNKGGEIDLVMSMLDYGKFQDQGVRGKNAYYADAITAATPYKFRDKMPPIKALSDWAKKKNIRLRDDKGRFSKGNYKTIGFLFARSIRDKGFRGSAFLTRPYMLALKRFNKPFLEAVGKDVAERIKQIKKETESLKLKDVKK